MRILLAAIITLLLPYTRLIAQSIYTCGFSDIGGKSVSLQPYAGKKVLLIIVSPANADTLAAEIHKFQQQYSSAVQVIGILSAEDGVREADIPHVRQSFSGTDITLTGIQHTHKGSNQSSLLQWLTNRKQNGHFDRDVTSPGQKFFVSENGKLYAVIGPEKHLDAPLIAKIVKANVN